MLLVCGSSSVWVMPRYVWLPCCYLLAQCFRFAILLFPSHAQFTFYYCYLLCLTMWITIYFLYIFAFRFFFPFFYFGLVSPDEGESSKYKCENSGNSFAFVALFVDCFWFGLFLKLNAKTIYKWRPKRRYFTCLKTKVIKIDSTFANFYQILFLCRNVVCLFRTTEANIIHRHGWSMCWKSLFCPFL